MDLLAAAEERILVLDGAMGTEIQALRLPDSAFAGNFGCNEILVQTAPDRIRDIHRAYLAAGADVIETDTFGANPLMLGEYDAAELTEELNAAAARLAREAVAEFHDKPRFVAGSVGPGAKLATLGQVSYDELRAGYLRQIRGLLAGGVDFLLFETVQDLLQVKAALAAAREAMAGGPRLPLYVSVTVEQTGSLLTGSDMSAVVAALRPFGIDALGLNCATGPLAMRPHLEALADQWPGLIGVYPNAGLPMPCATGICYPEEPAPFAATLGHFLAELPIHFVGGCCGTTPAHIRRLVETAAGRKPAPRRARFVPAIASLFNAVAMRQDPPPLFVGERANATGSRAFRDALLAADHDAAFEILNEQGDYGSHAADLSVAYAGQDEAQHMAAMMRRAARECRLPIFIDSTSAAVVEAALKLYPGRAVVNSINLEDGGKRADIVGPLAQRFGAALICLTIDEQGMAMTAERKFAVAKRLVELCVDRYGLRPEDLFVDALTFTIGSGDPTLKTAALETLAAIRRIKAEIPGVHCLLGLSNVSFGLSLKSRRVLNSVFLDLALRAGLDAAILNPKHIVPLAQLDETDVRRALDLIENRPVDGGDPLEAFLNHFAGRPDLESDEKIAELPPDQAVFEGIVAGKTPLILRNLEPLLVERSAESILNDLLVPAMKKVGELFGAGRMQLPFVLKSAEAMKRTVDVLRPHFVAADGGRQAKRLLLATVRGDVHDIGKNLVDIIVGNNGFGIVNLGTKVPVDTIVAEARAQRADVIGMSGLLVSSAMIMAENLRAMTDLDVRLPVLVGGAALTPEYVRDVLKPAYPRGSVTYCADAFAGLKAMQEIAAGRTPADPPAPRASTMPRDALPPGPMIVEKIAPPTPPFWGDRLVRNVNLDSVLSYINKVVLFRGRWGYRRGELPKDDFFRVMRDEVRPKYRQILQVVKGEKLFVPQFAYGYYRARGEGDAIVVERDGRSWRFEFPRRAAEPRICLADFVRPDGDVVGFFVATLGGAAAAGEQEIFRRHEFLDYYLLHGLAVEATDALAEYAHEIMRRELGVGEDHRLDWQELVTQKYRGSRYGFGYPACPDLAAHRAVFELLQPQRLGVTLAEADQMVPEFTTAAIVLHHPQAKYFAV